MAIRNPFRRYDTLRLEAAPLHTEKPEWAAHAPAQVEAALKRGAHVIALTEVHPPLSAQLAALTTKHGYHWVSNGHDTALLVKGSLKVLSSGSTYVAGRPRAYVTFEFHGSKVTVFGMHWATDRPNHQGARLAQTNSLIAALKVASVGTDLAFYMGDSNPNGALSHPATEPRKSLDAAGMPLAYEALHFPAGVGVTIHGHAKVDTRVTPAKVETFARLGSDHMPVSVSYRIRRMRAKR